MDTLVSGQEKLLEIVDSYMITPYSELSVSNLPREILNRTYIIARSYSAGIPFRRVELLSQSIYLLKYWHFRERINLSEAEDFNKNPDMWIRNHGDVLHFHRVGRY